MSFKKRQDDNKAKKPTGATATDKKANGGKWITYRITEADKKNAKVWATQVGELMPLLFEEIAKGYKFSLAGDQKNDSYVATLTDKRDDSPFFEYSLSQRGGHPESALAAVLFVHLSALAGGWVEQTKDDYLF